MALVIFSINTQAACQLKDSSGSVKKFNRVFLK